MRNQLPVIDTVDISNAQRHSHRQACSIVPASGPIPRGLTILNDRDLRQHGISSLSERWYQKHDPRAYYFPSLFNPTVYDDNNRAVWRIRIRVTLYDNAGRRKYLDPFALLRYPSKHAGTVPATTIAR